MPATVYDRIKETSTTTGTGDITLSGAVAQFKTFASRFATNDPIPYVISGQTGTEWEAGWGHLSAGTTLVRDTITASSNADAAVNFSSGTKDVFCTVIAAEYEDLRSRAEAALSMIDYPTGAL